MIEHAVMSRHELPSDEAWLYCATLTYDNKYDWRMPTYMERIMDSSGIFLATWDIEDIDDVFKRSIWRGHKSIYHILPVRDIK